MNDPVEWLRCHPRAVAWLLIVSTLNFVLNLLEVLGVT